MTRYITEMQLDIHNLHNITLFLVPKPLRVEIPYQLCLLSSINLILPWCPAVVEEPYFDLPLVL